MKRKKLPFTFDPAQLRADYEAIPRGEYTDVYNPFLEVNTLWRVDLAVPEFVPEMDRRPEFKPNELLLKSPEFLKVFETIESPVELYRVHELLSGAEIRKHRDVARNFETGVFRIHVPIVTDDEVITIHDGERVSMQPGECWYLDFDLYHEIQNNSTHARAHLIMDCVRNEWWEALLADT